MTIQKLPTSTIDVSSFTSDDDGKKLAVDANNALALIAVDSPFFDLPKFTFTGSVAGYTLGGKAPPTSNVIDKYPFSSDQNATDVGDLTIASEYYCGQSSLTDGYATGGLTNPSQASQKYPFASDENATGDTFTLSMKRYGGGGVSSQTHGYHAGGAVTPGQPASSPNSNIIDKFPFSADSPATDVGDLTYTTSEGSAGHSFDLYGYITGGSPATDTMNKFSLASDSNAIDIGNLLHPSNSGTGASSGTHGYHAGGDHYPQPDPARSSTSIHKFSFTSDGDAVDGGELSQKLSFVGGGSSSTTHGYTAGGRAMYPTAYHDDIQKYPFASEQTATDIGELTQVRQNVASNQSGITPIA